MSSLSFCPECGNKIQTGSKYCSVCGNNFESNVINSQNANKVNNIKRNKVVNSGHKGISKSKRRNSNKIFIFLLAAAIIIGIIRYFSSQTSKEENIIDNQPKVSGNVTYPSTGYNFSYSLAFAKGNDIILPLDLVKEKKLVKFDFINEGKTTPLLAYLTEDGKVVTAISICEPCNSTSFHIKGSDIICNSCGTTWDLNDLKAISGSCGKYPPDPVPSRVVGNEIQIERSLVDNWTARI